MNRIESLDWQRGLLAISVMAYHFAGWEFAPLDCSTLLGRLGIYSVSMFFVLSGLSIAIAYHADSLSTGSVLRFFIHRAFRILPLLWLAILFAVGAATLAGHPPSASIIALNLTTAFSVLSPLSYLNTGAWSIGNEMVFYALTPFILYAYNARLAAGNLLTLATVVLGWWFSASTLTVDQTLADQWGAYINPLNNLFLYCLGVALYYNCRRITFSATAAAACAISSAAIFAGFPVAGDQIHIATGAGRVVMCIASVLAVLAFYKGEIKLPGLLSATLSKIGIVAFGIYLLHPIAYRVVVHALSRAHIVAPSIITISASVVIALCGALLSFNLLERPLIRLGKRLTTYRPTRYSSLPLTP